MASTPAPQPTEDAPSVATHRFAKLNPFKSGDDEGGDELGQEADPDDIAGGGQHLGGAADAEARKKLRVSHALRSFLAKVGEIELGQVGGDDLETQHSEAVQAILARPQIKHPAYVHDRSHPISEYFISSSHNTYLVAKQLYGKSDTNAYKSHLKAGARCVEIDAWDSESHPDEPKVTHGYTLTSNLPFRAVCIAIMEQLNEEIAEAKAKGEPAPAPIFISLENHAAPHGQARIAAIMREVFGDKLVTEAVHEAGNEATLDHFGGRILVMVEYYGAGKDEVSAAAHDENKPDDDQSDSDSSDEEEEKAVRKKKKDAKVKIVPELAELGVYAQSMKPTSSAWANGEQTDPANHLINVEERAVAALIESSPDGLVQHNASHLMRIYPKGLRINSKNLNPVPFWGVGAQVCALNWQTFDASMQINEALFADTCGWVLKPAYLQRQAAARPTGKVKLTLEIAGANDLPVPDGRDKEIKPYVTCTLYHPNTKPGGAPEKHKTSHYRRHAHKLLFGKEQPEPTSPVWDPPEALEWNYEEDELVFLRLLVKSDDAFARNPAFLTSAVRLTSVPTEKWTFIRMLNLKGGETKATLLVKFTKTQV